MNLASEILENRHQNSKSLSGESRNSKTDVLKQLLGGTIDRPIDRNCGSLKMTTIEENSDTQKQGSGGCEGEIVRLTCGTLPQPASTHSIPFPVAAFVKPLGYSVLLLGFSNPHSSERIEPRKF
jgi:hypothetical protein